MWCTDKEVPININRRQIPKGAQFIWNTAFMISLIGVSLASCAVSPDLPTMANEQQRQLTEGYSLLYELVSKQSQVDSLFVLKTASKPCVQVVTQIAQASKDASARISSICDDDPMLVLDRASLPRVESATRDAIESATSKALLFAGSDFEVRLLLTQYEATRYGSHLAGELAATDPNTSRGQWLEEFADQYAQLNESVFKLIQGLNRLENADAP